MLREYTMLTRKFSNLTLALLLTCGVSAQVMALPEDRSQPIHISADTATRNDQTGLTVYKGRVELSQGTMQIAGSSVEIRQNKNGLQTIVAKGSPAKYQQKPTAEQSTTYAYGKLLEYNIKTQKLTITGDAQVTQGSDTFSGNRIVYDMNESTVNAFSDSKTEGSRVQMVIQPKPAATTEPEASSEQEQPQ